MAIIGSSGRSAVASFSIFLLSTCLIAPARAQSGEVSVHIAATTLDVALTALARQTGVEIVSTEPNLRKIRVRPLDGRLSVRKALERLLDHTGYRAVALSGGGYRIVAQPAPVVRPHAAAPPPVAPPAGTEAVPELVVTASKQHIPLLRFPGSLNVIDFDSLRDSGIDNLDELSRVAPVVQATQLGPGRNKLFVRGIADSSFNGATQSTASVYFGDVQLGYSGADPGLKLIDIQRIEVMEGPQGTLYGAGSVGGIVRITPNPVDLHQISGELGAGVLATVGGAPGFDGEGVLNLPILTEKAGIRLVGYRSRDGGYIDDRLRGLNDVNRVDTAGGRVALRVDPGVGWGIDASVLGQQIDGTDGQYAELGAGPLARRSVLAQPFSNNIILGRLVVTKRWESGLELLSATGVSQYRSIEVFDATAMPVFGPSIYRNTLTNRLLTQEARVSRTLPNGMSWVLGFALLHDRAEQDRDFGPVGAPHTIIGVTNIAESASAFGEMTIKATPSLSATLGARITTARNVAQPSTQPSNQPSIQPPSDGFFAGQRTTRVDPTVALSWLIAPHLSAFARYQSGYRTGGLAVARGVGRVAEFEPDDIHTGEVGMRYLPTSARQPSLSATLSYAYWRNIQADLIDRRGQPYTTNMGDARIYTFELSGSWSPLTGLRGTVAMLYTHNSVTGPLAITSVRNNRRLAETPPFAGDVAIDYDWRSRGNTHWQIGASAHYVGRAVLGTGDFLDVSHDAYFVMDANASWRRNGWAVSLLADNLLNARADRFPYGNPFSLNLRNQTTPLRPLNLRIGTSLAW